jgi:5-methylthioadenosine/S-adenosylhomocysteine deaminase
MMGTTKNLRGNAMNKLFGIDSMIGRRDVLRGAGAVGAATLMPSFASAAPAKGGYAQLPERGEFVIRNAYVLTMDNKLGDLPDGDIHVRNGAIVAVGKGLKAPGAKVIDGKTMIALPGFIETHWHMWGTAARNTAGDEAKMGYFTFAKVVGAIFKPEDNARGVRLGIAEAINSGLTTVHNWSHNIVNPDYADAELEAHRTFGHRALFGYGYFGIGRSDQAVNVADLPRVNEKWIKPSEGLLTLGVCSRGPENNNMDMCKTEWDAARKMGLRISTHTGTALARVKERQTIKHLNEAGLLGPDVILVHDTNTVDNDDELLAKTRTEISFSPYTEMRTGFGITPVQEMIKAGVPLSLSVDTTVLAGSCDMFAIMKAILNIADGQAQSEFAMSARTPLEMATMGGARALGIADRVGSLTPGKRADIILVRTTDVNIAPFTEPVHMIVQSANPSNVDTVMIDGRILKRNGKLVGIDVARIVREANDTAVRVRAEADRINHA